MSVQTMMPVMPNSSNGRINNDRSGGNDHRAVEISPEVKVIVDAIREGTGELRNIFASPAGRAASICSQLVIAMACLTTIAIAAIYIYLGTAETFPTWGQTFLVTTGSFYLAMAIISTAKWIALKGAMAYAINKGVEIADRMITVQNLENVTRTFQRNVDIAVGGVQQVAQNAPSPEVVDRIFTNFLSRVARNAENTMEGINYIAAGLANPNQPIAEAELNQISRRLVQRARQIVEINRDEVTNQAGEVAAGAVNVVQGIGNGLAEGAETLRVMTGDQEALRIQMNQSITNFTNAVQNLAAVTGDEAAQKLAKLGRKSNSQIQAVRNVVGNIVRNARERIQAHAAGIQENDARKAHIDNHAVDLSSGS